MEIWAVAVTLIAAALEILVLVEDNLKDNTYQSWILSRFHILCDTFSNRWFNLEMSDILWAKLTLKCFVILYKKLFWHGKAFNNILLTMFFQCSNGQCTFNHHLDKSPHHLSTSDNWPVQSTTLLRIHFKLASHIKQIKIGSRFKNTNPQ